MDREFRHGVGAAVDLPPRQAQEPTAAERAEQARAMAGNLDNYQQQVTAGIAAMVTAEVDADPIAWERGRKQADNGIKALAHAVDGAMAAKEHAGAPEVAAKLGGASELFADMQARLDAAPAKPAKPAPVLSCGDELLAALPPHEPVADAMRVYADAERAVAAVFRGAMLWSDIQAFGEMLANFPSHPIARRFARFGAERKGRLQGILKDSKVRARARAMEAARQQAAPLIAPPSGYRGPVTIDKPAEYEESRATIDIGPGAEDHERGAAKEGAPRAAQASVTPNPDGAVERANGTAIDKPAEYEETRATIDVDGGRDAAPDASRGDRDPAGAVARANGTAIDKPAEYEETRATVHLGSAPDDASATVATDAPARAPRHGGHDRDAGASSLDVAAASSPPLALASAQPMSAGPVSADPVLASGGREIGTASAHLSAVPGLLNAYQSAAGSLDLDTVADCGLRLATAWEQAQLALSSAEATLDTAEALGPVGLGFENDPDGTKHTARATELARLKTSAAGLRQSANEWAILVANRVRPSTFRFQPVPGVPAQMPPADLATHVREQMIKSVLLLDSLQEITALMDSAREDSPDAAEAVRKVAAQRVQFWISDRDGFLFLTHALQQLGHGALLLSASFDGKTLLQTAAAVSRGVPQTFGDIIDTIREAKERSLDNSMNPAGDQQGAAKLLELAQERLNEVVTYERLRERIPQGTHGLTLDHAWYLAQTAHESVRELWRMVVRHGRMPGAGGDRLWDHQILQVEMGEQPIKVLSGETGFESTFLTQIGPAADTSATIALAMGTMLIGGPAIVEAAPWLVGRLAALAEASAAMFSAAATWAMSNPQAALAITEFVASIGLNIGENGLDAFLEQLKTPEGMLQIAMDALMLWAGMGGGSTAGGPDVPAGQTAPRPARSGGSSSGFADHARDVVDKIRATKQAVVEYAKSRGAKISNGPDAEAVPADGPGPVKVPGSADELPDFSTIYAKKLEGVQGERAARGGRGLGRWPSGEERLSAGYVEPPADASVVKIRDRLMEEAKTLYPDDKALPSDQRADLHHKQVQYFEAAEQSARSRREDLETELRDAAPEQHRWINEQIELAKRTEAAAKVRPAQGKLPINHELAGGYVSIEDIDAKLADLTLKPKTRATLQEARKLMVETGRTRVRYKENGYVDLEDWTLEVNGVKAEYPGPLSGRNRGKDDEYANDWFADKIGDPDWEPPPGYTWHHAENVGRMILVPTAVHDAFKHTGGIPLYRVLTEDYDAY